jgi:DNA-binding protein H-NS
MSDDNNDLSEGVAAPELRDPSPDELEAQIEAARNHLAQLELQKKELDERRRLEAIKQIRDIWREHELTADEVMQADPFGRTQYAPPKAARPGDVDPKTGRAYKYRYGDNVWTGVGKRPPWVHELINSGGSLDDYLI